MTSLKSQYAGAESERGGVMFVSGFAPERRAKAGLGHLAYRGGSLSILYERHKAGLTWSLSRGVFLFSFEGVVPMGIDNKKSSLDMQSNIHRKDSCGRESTNFQRQCGWWAQPGEWLLLVLP